MRRQHILQQPHQRFYQVRNAVRVLERADGRLPFLTVPSPVISARCRVLRLVGMNATKHFLFDLFRLGLAGFLRPNLETTDVTGRCRHRPCQNNGTTVLSPNGDRFRSLSGTTFTHTMGQICRGWWILGGFRTTCSRTTPSLEATKASRSGWPTARSSSTTRSRMLRSSASMIVRER